MGSGSAIAVQLKSSDELSCRGVCTLGGEEPMLANDSQKGWSRDQWSYTDN
jgi:hypothetical protein